MSTNEQQIELITEDEAAELLKLKPQTLANWRCTKRVRLPYIKLGNKAIRYRRDRVLAFIAEQEVDKAA